MYCYRPDEIDRERAHHQALKQVTETNQRDIGVKRIGNLGELAFESFCREYLPVEMWHWENDDAMRLCNPESYSGHDFEIFGYTVDVKTSLRCSRFRLHRSRWSASEEETLQRHCLDKERAGRSASVHYYSETCSERMQILRRLNVGSGSGRRC
ncbi:hypothetical protein SAMN04487950_4577 [Halogranum rubrum]|uniref:DUF7961 domain-containing protein n=1 Tax=Halogranum rubrum TaxID=553466 RepID=A0A1I4JN41_9EURY|nr:hypothetical protein SAMN04487950_4577 [Halogranum rubrum]